MKIFISLYRRERYAVAGMIQEIQQNQMTVVRSARISLPTK
jgi:hypothetical protein